MALREGATSNGLTFAVQIQLPEKVIGKTLAKRIQLINRPFLMTRQNFHRRRASTVLDPGLIPYVPGDQRCSPLTLSCASTLIFQGSNLNACQRLWRARLFGSTGDPLPLTGKITKCAPNGRFSNLTNEASPRYLLMVFRLRWRLEITRLIAFTHYRRSVILGDKIGQLCRKPQPAVKSVRL